MKPTWKKSLSLAVLSVSLVLAATPATLLAQEAGEVVQIVRGQHALTPQVRADIKSVYSERVQDSTKIGAVVRLYNEGSRVTRVPDYELRAKTADGIEYTLRASAGNARAIQPKEQVDLSYMLNLDYIDATALVELSWVEVDEYVYPKLETPVLAVPVEGIVWHGNDAPVAEDSFKQWGEPFKLPVQSDTLQYTPVTLINEKTPQGPVVVITLIAENTGSRTETVPDFRINGRSEARSYEGKRAEASVELKPGEKKYIHYGILTENNVVLKSLDVLTPETFVQLGANNAPTIESFTVGRLSVALPQSSTVDAAMLPGYKVRDPIFFDPLNKLIDKETEISLVDLSMNESESAGYNTIIAKFKVTNNGERPVPLPVFQTELTNAEGFRYGGIRQTTSVQQLAPKLSYIINYSYAVPSTETGADLLMKLQDNQTIAPYNIPIAGFKTAVASPESANPDEALFYPYQVKFHSVLVSMMGNAMGQFSYKMKLDLDITTLDNAIADANSANMKVELVDNAGRMIAAETLPFAGVNKLISGTQYFVFQNLVSDQFNWPVTVKIYESIQTPTGEANRLVKTVKQ